MAWWHADLSHPFFPIIICGCLEEATIGRREVLPWVKVFFFSSYGKALFRLLILELDPVSCWLDWSLCFLLDHSRSSKGHNY